MAREGLFPGGVTEMRGLRAFGTGGRAGTNVRTATRRALTFEPEEFDFEEAARIGQRFASPATRKARQALVMALQDAQNEENPAVRALRSRQALEGFGTAISEAVSGGQRIGLDVQRDIFGAETQAGFFNIQQQTAAQQRAENLQERRRQEEREDRFRREELDRQEDLREEAERVAGGGSRLFGPRPNRPSPGPSSGQVFNAPYGRALLPSELSGITGDIFGDSGGGRGRGGGGAGGLSEAEVKRTLDPIFG